MEHEGSLPQSQVPATCPLPEPHRSSPYPHITLPLDPSLYYLPMYAWVFQVVSFSQVNTPKIYIHLSFPPCTAPTFPLDFVTKIVFGEKYRSLRSSLRTFLHSCFTSSLLCPDILYSTVF